MTTVSTDQNALDLYRNALNFNVISRYDNKIKQLLYHTSHCVIYKYDATTEEWEKTDFSGTLALYLRDFATPHRGAPPTVDTLRSLFCYGLILMNRNNPECFSLGLVPNKITQHIFPQGVNNMGILSMDVELNGNLIIVKNLLGEIYGLWVFNEAEREKLYKLLEFCLTNDKTVF
ncbi:mRNA-decapping enzyme subunit 1 [Meyerozyma sp. JA9]|nr:mRNA-decapping enzyme subunit 1 [Meyerozyma sp. JA9]